MQCQGKTRIGRRCRNRSLDGELFCDVHMRINHTQNLALLIPAGIGLTTAYFFFFGLFYKTAIFNIFGISYLQYAGLEDLILAMLQFGGLVSLILISLWLVYILLLTVFFSFAFIYRMFRSTGQSSLKPGRRLKVILLGLYVLLANILLRALYLIPSQKGRRGTKIKVSRDAFSRALLNLHNEDGNLRAGRPFQTARHTFQDFLSFKAMGNHRFVAFTLLLFILSSAMTYYATGRAEYARDCALANARPAPIVAKTTPASAYIINQPCQLASDQPSATPKGQLARMLSGFFDYRPVTLNTKRIPVKLLHLATTSRFDLLFNGQNSKTLIIPKGIPGGVSPDKKGPVLAPRLLKLEQKFVVLEERLRVSGKHWTELGTALKQTNRQLSGLQRQQLITSVTAAASSKSENSRAKEIPAFCWQKIPDYIVSYDRGQTATTDAEVLDIIVRLAIRYGAEPDQNLVIAGYADPSGSKATNDRISRQRATKIGELFEKLGLNRHRLYPVTMGENDSLRLPQRRVEIRSYAF